MARVNSFEVDPPQFSVAKQEEIWRGYRPKARLHIEKMETAEQSWTEVPMGKVVDRLTELMTVLAGATCIYTSTLDDLFYILAHVPTRHCIYALAWLDTHRPDLARVLVYQAFKSEGNDPHKWIVWQRCMDLQKFHVLNALTSSVDC